MAICPLVLFCLGKADPKVDGCLEDHLMDDEVFATDAYGRSALFFACEAHQWDMAVKIVEYLRVRGSTPEEVRKLVNAVDTRHRNGFERSPAMFMAFWPGGLDVIQAVDSLGGIDFEVLPAMLFQAYSNAQWRCASWILERAGPDAAKCLVNASANGGKITCLHLTCMGNHTRQTRHILRIIASAESDWADRWLEAQTCRGETAFQWTVKEHRLECARVFMQELHSAGRYAETLRRLVDSRGDRGRTPLMMAFLNGKFVKYQLIRDMLVLADADASLADDFGMTALHYACKFGSEGFAQSLLTHTRRRTPRELVNLKIGASAKTPIQLIRHDYSFRLALLLWEHGAVFQDTESESLNRDMRWYLRRHTRKRIVRWRKCIVLQKNMKMT